ncbi:MAG: CinA family nicotinamide mononucleotide deamidase-related protein [Brevinematales bacterium]|nr:CinA family nicotinamide mononucleotide deamidase-related protein [Brevinematales bacterium]
MLAIGNELLENVNETNSLFLSNLLAKEGMKLERVLVVRDNLDEIKEGFNFLSQISDIIISSGGLGPTKDDLTKEGLASFLGEELYLDERILENIKNIFEKRGRKFHPSNKKQALIFKNSTFLENPVGTAPGLYLKRNGKEYILLPGVPSEWKEMLTLYLNDFIISWGKLNQKRVFSFFYDCFDIAEGELDYILQSRLDKRIKSYGTIAKSGIITFRLDIESYEKKNAEIIAKEFVNEKLSDLKDKIFENTFGSIEEHIVFKMKEKNKKLVVAESCTGGLLSKRITDIPGSSNVFYGGIVSYSNEMKNSILNVPEEIISKYGAVSSETACFMDKGLRELFPDVDYRISITGIAGPDGGTIDKPVGTVYAAFGKKEETKIEKLNLIGNRTEIREKSVNYVFGLLLKELYS